MPALICFSVKGISDSHVSEIIKINVDIYSGSGIGLSAFELYRMFQRRVSKIVKNRVVEKTKKSSWEQTASHGGRQELQNTC